VLLCLFSVFEGAESGTYRHFSASLSETIPCAGIQDTANTGNAQNLIDLVQYSSADDDLEFEKIGSTVGVNPMNMTTCDQQVNRAVSAFG
jgi:hypothetical protein